MIPIALIFEPGVWTEIHRRTNACNIHSVFGGMKRDTNLFLILDRLNEQCVLRVLHRVFISAPNNPVTDAEATP